MEGLGLLVVFQHAPPRGLDVFSRDAPGVLSEVQGLAVSVSDIDGLRSLAASARFRMSLGHRIEAAWIDRSLHVIVGEVQQTPFQSGSSRGS